MNVAAGLARALDQRPQAGRGAGGRRELGPAVRASDVGARLLVP
jgi:hypothetical protein